MADWWEDDSVTIIMPNWLLVTILLTTCVIGGLVFTFVFKFLIFDRVVYRRSNVSMQQHIRKDLRQGHKDNRVPMSEAVARSQLESL